MNIINWLRREFYVIVAFMLFTIMVSNDTFLPAMPIIAEYFDSSIAVINLSFSMMMLGAFLPQIPVGIISDKVGRRPMILIGSVLFLGATFVISKTTSLNVFMACRFLQGAASAFINSTARAMISEHYDYKKRVSAMSILSRLYLLAPMTGPLIGTYILIIANNDWHYIYIYNNMLFVILFIIALFCIPETLPKLVKAEQDRLNPDSPEAKQSQPEHKKESLIDLIKIKSYFYLVSAISWRMILGVLWISASAKVIMIDMATSKEIYSYSQIFIFSSLILGTILTTRVASDMAPSIYIKNHTLITLLIGIPLFALTLWNFNLYTVIILMSFLLFSNGAIIPVLQSIVVTEIKSKGFAMAVMMTVIGGSNVISTAIPPLLYDYDSRIIIAILAVALLVSSAFSHFALPHVQKIENHPDN